MRGLLFLSICIIVLAVGQVWGAQIGYLPTDRTIRRSVTVGEDASQIAFMVGNFLHSDMMVYVITDDAEWLSCDPPAGVSYGEPDLIAVNFSTSGLGVGEYSATVTITAPLATNSPQTLRVLLTVEEKPVIARLPLGLSNSCWQGESAPPESFEVWNSGGGTLSYSITDNASWLSCNPTGGISTGEKDPITVNYNTSGLSVGDY